jgi:hypothetical protein
VIETPAPTAPRVAQYITILEDESVTFPWSPNGYETEFLLRQVPDEVQTALTKKFTKNTWNRGTHQQEQKTDWVELNASMLEYAICGWERLMSPPLKEVKDPGGKILQHARDAREIPYRSELVRKLPERLQREIIRICVGKEAGEVMANEAPVQFDREVAKNA